jgi:hypothetical protein
LPCAIANLREETRILRGKTDEEMRIGLVTPTLNDRLEGRANLSCY